MLSTKELYPCNNHSNPDRQQISTDPCRLKNFITQDTMITATFYHFSSKWQYNSYDDDIV